MDARTLEALKGSIAKWEGILKGKPDRGIDDCVLCQVFVRDSCLGCPVRDRSGHSFCEETPHPAWIRHHHKAHPGVRPVTVECPECTHLAQAELDFLKGLLPKESDTPRVDEVLAYWGPEASTALRELAKTLEREITAHVLSNEEVQESRAQLKDRVRELEQKLTSESNRADIWAREDLVKGDKLRKVREILFD